MRGLLAALAVMGAILSNLTTASAQAGMPWGEQIAWKTIETVIQDELKNSIPAKVSGTETCPTILCPDAHWSVTLSPSFHFTKTGLPTIHPRGPSGWLDGVDIELDVQGELDVDANAYIEIGGPAKDIDPPTWHLKKLIGFHVMATIFTDPTPEKDPISIQVSLSDDGGNVDVNGLNHDFIILGAEGGALATIVLFGDPVVGGIIGAVLGNVAAEKAEAKIRDNINKQFAAALTKASLRINSEVQSRVVPVADRAYDAIAALIAALLG